MNKIELLRQYKIAGYAVFDFVVAFLGVAVLAPLLSKLFRKLGLEIPFVSWMYLVVPIGIVAHIVVGRITPLTENFLDLRGHYLLKLVVVLLVFLAVRGIKRIG